MDEVTYPEIIRFAPGAKSYWYVHAARVIIDGNNYVVKDSTGNPGRMALPEELGRCVTVTREMARTQVALQRARANAIVGAILQRG